MGVLYLTHKAAGQRSIARVCGAILRHHPADRHARQPAGAGAGAHGARGAGRGAWPRPGADRDRGRSAPRGDRIQDRPLAEAGGKGLFTKEIEEALLAGAIDLAVHSAKDMPTVLPAGLVLVGLLPREDAARCVHQPQGQDPSRDLPRGATVGTASLRRQAHGASGRGRISRRAAARQCRDAAAQARRGRGRRDAAGAGGTEAARPGGRMPPRMLDVDEFLPAVGQGAIGIETRADDARTRDTARADRSCRHVQRARLRARLPRRARRLVPHADRRPCDARRRTAAVSAA